jgi:2-polyprenyl-3-methyl-5-hydroxy-6-metoxy-1,4-benzoquinol methylase
MNEKNAWELHTAATEDQFASEEISLGPWSSFSLRTDPKHLVFVLSRYKFALKMLEGKKSILEIGCGDGVGANIVGAARDLSTLFCIDWDKRNIEGNIRRNSGINKKIHFETHNINESTFINSSVPNGFEAAFMIDVIEHVEPKKEHAFMVNVCKSLSSSGLLLTGTPNISASQYASPQSNAQHINLKSPETLRITMEKYFQHVFNFGMNDEVLHTGYSPMCHYIWTLAVNPK